MASVEKIALGESAGVAEAAALHDRILAALAGGPAAVEIDGGVVQRADTAVVQLLCALTAAAAQAGVAVRWTGISRPLADSVELLGATARLGWSVRESP